MDRSIDDTDQRILRVLGDQLDRSRQTVEAIAVALCLDTDLAARHSSALQRFDHLAQILGEAATLLRSGAPLADALENIGLEEMQSELKHGLQNEGGWRDFNGTPSAADPAAAVLF